VKRAVPAVVATAVLAGALVASGCGSSDSASTDTTRAAASASGGTPYVAGAGDGPDRSLAEVNQSAAPPIAKDTDEQLKQAMVKISTFPTVLDPKLWNGEEMKADVRANTIQNVNTLVKRLGGAGAKVDAIELFGSNASYEYDDKADFGVHVFLSSPTVTPDNLDSLAKLLSSYTELKQEGRINYYGVPLEVTFHGKRGASYQPKAGSGQYSLTTGQWIEKPTQQPNAFDRATMVTDARGFITKYNALVEEYAKDKKAFACEKFGALDDEMKAYRGAGLDTGGQRSTQNLTYRALRRISVNIPDMVDELEDECNYLKESLP
jgi:hypothetical protein